MSAFSKHSTDFFHDQAKSCKFLAHFGGQKHREMACQVSRRYSKAEYELNLKKVDLFACYNAQYMAATLDHVIKFSTVLDNSRFFQKM